MGRYLMTDEERALAAKLAEQRRKEAAARRDRDERTRANTLAAKRRAAVRARSPEFQGIQSHDATVRPAPARREVG